MGSVSDSLSRELDRYLAARVEFAPVAPDARLFVGANKTTLSRQVRRLERFVGYSAGGHETCKGENRMPLRSSARRCDPAVEPVEQQGLHSIAVAVTYMGHVDIIGTETIPEDATPELLDLAANRFTAGIASIGGGEWSRFSQMLLNSTQLLSELSAADAERERA